MVKDDKHRTRGLVLDGREIVLQEEPVLFKYIGTIQEEVHRFAIDYHHNLRGRTVQKSLLDQIDGIGEKRKNALFAHFGSLEAIRQADVEALRQAPGMNVAAAEKVRQFFDKMQ
jgi:excinuclease ABC subunit C